MLITTLAFVAPSISWREIRDYLREQTHASESEAADMLGIEQPAAPAGYGPTQTPALPRSHLLTGGFATSQKVVMRIKTGELPPMPMATITVYVPRYYWRSVTYDKYVSGGWETNYATSQSIRANTPLIPGLLAGYKLVQMDV